MPHERRVDTDKHSQRHLLFCGKAEEHFPQYRSACVNSRVQGTQGSLLQDHSLTRGTLVFAIATWAKLRGPKVSQHAFQLLAFHLSL